MSKGRLPKDFIPDYCGNVGADFELCLENLNDYLAIYEVSDSDEKKRLFLNLAGLSVSHIVKGLVVPTNGDAYDAVTTAVLSHFHPASNTTSERHKFRHLRQLTDESVTSFVGRLREKAEACEFSSTSVDTVENGQVRYQLEMLGIMFALIRFRQYVPGRHIEVYTDHKPLLPIVQKPFDDVPPRLQRWLVSLMPYDYALKYVPGKQLSCTDALSRAPVSTSDVSTAESRSLHEYIGFWKPLPSASRKFAVRPVTMP